MTLPDLEPAARKAAHHAYFDHGGNVLSLTSPDRLDAAIRAYLAAARSTVPEAGKAVDAAIPCHHCGARVVLAEQRGYDTEEEVLAQSATGTDDVAGADRAPQAIPAEDVAKTTRAPVDFYKVLKRFANEDGDILDGKLTPVAIALADEEKASVASLRRKLEEHANELETLRALLNAIIARDDRNGSLPEWYRHEIDAVYSLPRTLSGASE